MGAACSFRSLLNKACLYNYRLRAIELGRALTVVILEGPAAALRRLTQARERSMKRHTALTNQLQSLIAIIFPVLLRVVRNVKTATALYLLKHCPTAQSLVAYDLDDLTRNQKGEPGEAEGRLRKIALRGGGSVNRRG